MAEPAPERTPPDDTTEGERCIQYGTGQPYGNSSFVRCSQPAATHVLAGCLHEHVGHHPWCSYHAAEARAGRIHCGACLNVGCRCVLVVVKEPSHA